jgi:hypothetical protein
MYSTWFKYTASILTLYGLYLAIVPLYVFKILKRNCFNISECNVPTWIKNICGLEVLGLLFFIPVSLISLYLVCFSIEGKKVNERRILLTTLGYLFCTSLIAITGGGLVYSFLLFYFLPFVLKFPFKEVGFIAYYLCAFTFVSLLIGQFNVLELFAD